MQTFSVLINQSKLKLTSLAANEYTQVGVSVHIDEIHIVNKQRCDIDKTHSRSVTIVT